MKPLGGVAGAEELFFGAWVRGGNGRAFARGPSSVPTKAVEGVYRSGRVFGTTAIMPLPLTIADAYPANVGHARFLGTKTICNALTSLALPRGLEPLFSP